MDVLNSHFYFRKAENLSKALDITIMWRRKNPVSECVIHIKSDSPLLSYHLNIYIYTLRVFLNIANYSPIHQFVLPIHVYVKKKQV